MNNHQKSTFYQLGIFFKPSLSLVRTEFKKNNLTKIEFCQSFIFMQKSQIKGILWRNFLT
ncbi:hypothetical protein [uncultured Gammaproteobacteria bacterium]|nr:hypothetical protein [uncultured Gammaproteobacteria bacterium]